MSCKYCGRRGGPGLPTPFDGCANTRDMEDFAELGDDTRFYQLAKIGGGEKGLNYVIANREARRQKDV